MAPTRTAEVAEGGRSITRLLDGTVVQVEPTWAVVNGRAEVVRIVISTAEVADGLATAHGPELAGLTSARLRELALPAKLRESRRLAGAARLAAAERNPGRANEHRQASKPFLGKRGRQIPSDHLEQVAAIYRATLRLGGDPTAAVADQLHLSRSTAAKHVSRARDEGHLPPTRRGKASA